MLERSSRDQIARTLALKDVKAQQSVLQVFAVGLREKQNPTLGLSKLLIETLQCIADGKVVNAEIAEHLGLSRKVVEKRKEKIKKVLNGFNISCKNGPLSLRRAMYLVIMHGLVKPVELPSPEPKLSQAEKQVLSTAQLGFENDEIAVWLNLSKKTIENRICLINKAFDHVGSFLYPLAVYTALEKAHHLSP